MALTGNSSALQPSRIADELCNYKTVAASNRQSTIEIFLGELLHGYAFLLNPRNQPFLKIRSHLSQMIVMPPFL